MEIEEKLKILADSAKYDASCSSSGSNRRNTSDGIGNGDVSGICHSWGADGRCISLLKILMSNCCMYDCKYCINRCSNSVPRATFSPREVANLTIGFYKRNYIEGLFLSSAVVLSPDNTMEMMYEAIYILRNEYNFHGYIHAKAIPGASPELIHKVGLLVDRISTNIELPSQESLKKLAPEKSKASIITPMSYISTHIQNRQNLLHEKHTHKLSSSLTIKNADSHIATRRTNSKELFVPAGQTTQMIVGASPENDLKILKLSESLYEHFHLKRVYYSAYISVNEDSLLPTLDKPPLLRENRLYQADWLLRFYGFKADELLNEEHPNFNPLLDPKCDWALHHLEQFPIEIQTANYHTLLRVPGIGVISAKKIILARKEHHLTFTHLKKLGIVLKRARYFITCNGKYYDNIQTFNDKFIQTNLLYSERQSIPYSRIYTNLSV